MRWFLIPLLLTLTACGLPRDAAGTRHALQGGVMRVGVAPNPPWVIDGGGNAFSGIEAEIAGDLASAAGARLEWVRMPEFEIMHALRDGSLQLGIGGFNAALPWAREVALTRPYVEPAGGIAHVLVGPPGESAWLLFIDQRIYARRDAIRDSLARAIR